MNKLTITISHRQDGTSAVVWDGFSNVVCGVREPETNRKNAELVGLALFEYHDKRGVKVKLETIEEGVQS